MKSYACNACDYVYDPAKGDEENGIPPGTPFEELPEDWVCPVCGVDKDEFEPVEQVFLKSGMKVRAGLAKYCAITFS